jgi:hypothetical protein
LFRPHVVLMTTHAPGFSSVAIARRLQRLSKDAVPFVYLLDAPDPELRLHVLERGHGVETLCKPLDLRELVARVRGCSGFGKGCGAPRAGRRRDYRPPGPAHRDLDAAVDDRVRPTGIAAAASVTAAASESWASSCRAFRHLRRTFGRGWRTAWCSTRARCCSSPAVRRTRWRRVAENRFAVLLPSTPQEGLPLLRSRLADRFERARFQVDGRVVRTAVSIGCAAFPDVQGNARRLLAAAFSAVPQPDLVPTLVLS